LFPPVIERELRIALRKHQRGQIPLSHGHDWRRPGLPVLASWADGRFLLLGKRALPGLVLWRSLPGGDSSRPNQCGIVLRGAAQSCRCSCQTGFILNLPPGTHGRYCKPPFIMREYILCGAWADCLMRQRCASGSNRGGYPIDYQGSSRQSTWSRIRVGFRRLPFTPPVAFSGRT